LDVVGALTTTTEGYNRVSIHGVRNSILAAQVAAAGLQQYRVDIPQVCPNEIYEERMGAFIMQAKEAGITHCIFGDLFLEDVRAYRCQMLAGTGITPVFPAWGIPTDRLARQLINGGVRTHIVCIDTTKLNETFCGRPYTHDLVDALPADVDPCAERGEFHTLVSDGPMFDYPVPIMATGSTRRDGPFMWADFDLGSGLPCRAPRT
jgi:diphthamide synthase (EF-2-diphthine--ammonia ligase)